MNEQNVIPYERDTWYFWIFGFDFLFLNGVKLYYAIYDECTAKNVSLRPIVNYLNSYTIYQESPPTFLTVQIVTLEFFL